MNTLRTSTLTLIFAICLVQLSTSGCMHNPTTGVGAGQTALQKTIVATAAVVKANNAVEQAVEDAVTQHVLTPAKARPVIDACSRVNTAAIAVTGITSRGTEASWNVDGPKVRALLAATPLTIPSSTASAIDLLIATANSAIQLLIQSAQGVN